MFKKEVFPIQMIEAAPRKVEFVKGWTLNGFGFYKGKKNWVATDLLSGCQVCQCKSRKECIEWIERNKEQIKIARRIREYDLKVLNFYRLLKEEEKEYA